jgi:hypothetical protein
MKTIRRVALLAVLSAAVGGVVAPAAGQTTTGRTAAAGRAVSSERNAIELKQGMALNEVQRLLGKPRRTALKDTGGSGPSPSQGSLQWTYVWPSASSSDNVLRVEFAAKAPAEWYVNSWEWTSF